MASIDELHARRVAAVFEVPVTGTLSVILTAKRRGLVPAVRPLLDRLQELRFRMSTDLIDEILTNRARKADAGSVASTFLAMYGECMARLTSTTVRLEEDDIRALKKARAAGHSASELVRKGLRVVASRYYSGRRPPTTGLFESTDSKLGDESLLFKDLKD